MKAPARASEQGSSRGSTLDKNVRQPCPPASGEGQHLARASKGSWRRSRAMEGTSISRDPVALTRRRRTRGHPPEQDAVKTALLQEATRGVRGFESTGAPAADKAKEPPPLPREERTERSLAGQRRATFQVVPRADSSGGTRREQGVSKGLKPAFAPSSAQPLEVRMTARWSGADRNGDWCEPAPL